MPVFRSATVFGRTPLHEVLGADDRRHRIQPRAVARARQLRKEASIPERILRGVLRSRRLAGLKFRRQHVIGPFFSDYCCVEAKLVVELDGRSHEKREEYDERRTAFIEQRGFRVLRARDDDLLKHREAVARAIAEAAGVEW